MSTLDRQKQASDHLKLLLKLHALAPQHYHEHHVIQTTHSKSIRELVEANLTQTDIVIQLTICCISIQSHSPCTTTKKTSLTQNPLPPTHTCSARAETVEKPMMRLIKQ